MWTRRSSPRKALLPLIAPMATALAGAAHGQSCLPPSEPFQFLYSFSDYPFENEGPHDVAVFGTCGKKEWVFVTDPVTSRILRFDLDGANDPPVLHFPPSFLGDGPFGVAVNDIEGHPNHSHVYVTDATGAFGGLIKVYDTSGCYLADIALGGGENLVYPDGIAVDDKGNVYVVDVSTNKVHRIDWEDLTAVPSCSLPLGLQITPALTLDVSPQETSPIDVSVDPAGRMHVTYHHCVAGLLTYEADGTFVSNIPSQGLFKKAHGVDARDPFANPWFTDTDLFSNIHWDLLYDSWTGGPTLVHPTWTLDRLGMETQRYVVDRDPIPPGGGERRFRCEERLFTAGLPEIGVYGRDFYSVPRPPGLVAWFPLEGTGASVTNLVGPNGFRVANPTVPIPGRGAVRCSLCFDGEGGFVDVPSYKRLSFRRWFTMEGWIRAELDADKVYFLDKRDGSARGVALFLEDGWLGVELDDGSTHQEFAPQVDENFVSDGAWHHYAVVVRLVPPEVRLYVDAVTTGAMTTPLTPTDDLTTTAHLVLGQESFVLGDDGFRGNLDEVSIYARALDANEIERIACAYCAGKHFPPIWPIGLYQ